MPSVLPEMATAASAPPCGRLAGDAAGAGRHRLADYSLFLGDDGLLVGYVEADDLPALLEAMA